MSLVLGLSRRILLRTQQVGKEWLRNRLSPSSPPFRAASREKKRGREKIRGGAGCRCRRGCWMPFVKDSMRITEEIKRVAAAERWCVPASPFFSSLFPLRRFITSLWPSFEEDEEKKKRGKYGRRRSLLPYTHTGTPEHRLTRPVWPTFFTVGRTA